MARKRRYALFLCKKSAVPDKGQEGGTGEWHYPIRDLAALRRDLAVWHLMGRFGAGRWRWMALLASNLLFYALGATPTLWYSLAAATLAAFAAALAMDATEKQGAGAGWHWQRVLR